MGIYLLAEIPSSGTVTFFEIKDRDFGHVHQVSNKGYDDTTDSTEDPALRSIEEGGHATTQVFPAAQRLQTMRIGNVVVYPVRRSELIVPNSLVWEDGAFRLGEGVGVIVESVEDARAKGRVATMVSGICACDSESITINHRL